MKHTLTLFIALLLLGFDAAAQQALRIGLMQCSAGKPLGPYNAAALAFAETKGNVVQLSPAKTGGWQDAGGAPRSLEECDVIWINDGDGQAHEQWLG